jgi:AraC family transcriptional regulator of adaptative response/methylated-DNA-[protein]-cysteine methyltransferase
MANNFAESTTNYLRIERAIHFLCEHAEEQPSLPDLAAYVGISEHHLQKIFSRWAGVSPKRFVQFLTKQRAKQSLAQSQSVLDVALDLGLSGPSRLHDLLISCEAMTPGEIKSLGAGLLISHGYALSPFGLAYIAWTSRGICHMAFCQCPEPDVERALGECWSGASFLRDDSGAAKYIDQIFQPKGKKQPLQIVLKGTNFQLKVWEALLNIGEGELISYSQLATMIGSPKASRAVGTAVASNNIGFLIPCHRVIRESGDLGNYRWGIERKAAIQGWEAAQSLAERS